MKQPARGLDEECAVRSGVDRASGRPWNRSPDDGFAFLAGLGYAPLMRGISARLVSATIRHHGDFRFVPVEEPAA
jgi:hypothetical protein